MVLGSNLNLTGQEILDRMIAAAVTEFEFIGFSSVRQRYNLMSQADSKHRIFAPQTADKTNHTLYILRVSGAIRKENPIRCQFFNRIGCCIPGKNRNIAAPVVQPANNVLLHSAVDCDNMIFRIFRRSLNNVLRTYF